MANIFSSVPVTRPKRTAFSLSHQALFTTNFGRLTPNCFLDMVPGDTAKLNAVPLVRFSPMSSPPFGQVDVSTIWMAVPYRLVNHKFQKMITGYYQDTAGSSQFLKRPNMMFDFVYYSSDLDPFLTKLYSSSQWLRHNLLDYCGIRSGVDGKAPSNDRIECGRLLAFWMVYYEYFVDQNVGYRPDPIFSPSEKIKIRLEDGSTLDTPSIMNWEQFTQICLYQSTDFPAVGGYLTIGDCIANGLDLSVYKFIPDVLPWLFCLPSKCWPKDYFTSALPWAQKGNPVTVPIGNSGIISLPVGRSGGSNGASVTYAANGQPANNKDLVTDDNGYLSQQDDRTGIYGRLNIDNFAGVTAQGRITDELSFAINDLRASYALQTWLEKNARCGSRYVEQILSHFGVRSSDSRLQRPEYLGGFKIPVHVSSTAQTSENGSTPQGNLAGQGLASGAGKDITFFAEEHMYVFCLTYVQPKAIYSQGLSRLLKRSEFYDFYFPEFAHLGEQEITNGEIYYDPTAGDTNNDTFGYQSRYSEYKFKLNELHGDFMHPSLKSWIFGDRTFGSAPSLSPEFLQVSTSVEPSLNNPFPVLQSDSFDKLYCQIDFGVNMLRPMPKYGVPYL